ncbi:hypothetical protein IGI04_030306 [Brassica rapa subsp. trilocularis]|uniref:Uncharacterized protein n=1 Tax=Brassica rapa subsp. trilocularis TaxID=1813537 RepID=A0ABQ7LT19_BRACM|nr:hypothetical protein IGI04_030306 [Brassica rapa subsp. trilocularis]
MKLRKAKEANQDIGAIKTSYRTNQEEFINETGFPGFYTQQEHTENWFHTKKSNGLGDMPFTNQTINTASELVLFKESNSLLKECATQAHVWKPGDHSLHLRPLGELIPCTRPHWISQILHHLNLQFLEPICFKSQRLVFYTLGCDLAIFFHQPEAPQGSSDLPKVVQIQEAQQISHLAEILSFKPHG